MSLFFFFLSPDFDYYRFCTKQGIHTLPPIVTRFPPAIYHLPSFSSSSETHFIRSPIPYNKNNSSTKSLHTHQFDPFLEISHRLILTVHFNKVPNLNVEPVSLEFPLIITDYPAVTTESLAETTSHLISTEQHTQPTITVGGGDDAVNVDLDLPEYTPRYEENSSPIPTN